MQSTVPVHTQTFSASDVNLKNKYSFSKYLENVNTLYLIDPSWMDKKCSQVAVTCIVRGLFVSEGEGIGVAATQDSTGSTVNLSLLFLC